MTSDFKNTGTQQSSSRLAVALHSAGPTFDYWPVEQPILIASFHYFPQFLQANAETRSQTTPCPVPSAYVLLHLSESRHLSSSSLSSSSTSCQVSAMACYSLCYQFSSPPTFLFLRGLYTTIQFRQLLLFILLNCFPCWIHSVLLYSGAWGSVVGRSRDRSPVRSLGIFSVIPSDKTVCPEVDPASENKYQGFLLG